MRVNAIKKIGLGFVFGAATLFGASQVANAQIRIYTQTDPYNQGYGYDNNQREMLRQAINRGYQQGFRQGQVDRRYGRRTSYYNSGMYQNGTYGYRTEYNNGYGGYRGDMRSRYQRAFQRGFEKGYEDGYNSQSRYGYRSSNGLQVIGSILNSLINQ
jgi:flagellar biosynthesis/type III secretory pathway protein FliH